MHEKHNFELIEPTTAHMLKAEEVASHSDKNSGFPSMYNSIYHAIAIVENGHFLTADKKHAIKTGKFDSLTLLKDWKDLF